ncbi:MAG TPA: PQQ-binding-like beta-propeller repeat protein [Vicinamibacterales bacterium]
MKLLRYVEPRSTTLMFLLAVACLAVSAPASAQARRPTPPRPVDRKKEARKVPPLHMTLDWSATLSAPPAGGMASDDTHAFVPLRTGELAAVSLTDGRILWTAPAKAAAPLATGEGHVFLAAQNRLQALAIDTGKPTWDIAAPGLVTAPLVWQNGWLLASNEAGDLVMFRAATGELLWRRPMGAPIRVRPVLADDHVYCLLEDGRALALALATGNVVWDAKLPANGTMLHVIGDRLFVGGGDRYFYCLDALKGNRKWRWRTGGAIVGTVAADQDNVYFVSLDNVLRALNRAHGDQRWKASLPTRPTAGPFLHAGLLLVAGRAPALTAYQLVDGSPAGSVELAGEPAGPPHFVPMPDSQSARIVLVTGEGEIQMLVPGPAPIVPKPILGLPMYLALPAWTAAE